jgi:hypothetical protein
MKCKILRNITVGVGCLMLALTLSSTVVTHNSSTSHVVKPMEESPFL